MNYIWESEIIYGLTSSMEEMIDIGIYQIENDDDDY